MRYMKTSLPWFARLATLALPIGAAFLVWVAIAAFVSP